MGRSYRLHAGIFAVVVTLFTATPASAQLVINPTFDSTFNSSFGTNAAAAQAAWIAAANTFTSNFSDPITVNITVKAVSGTSVFGQSSYFLNSFTYTNLRNAVVADAKSASDATAIGAGGSMVTSDPAPGTHGWWVNFAQQKALGLRAGNNTAEDGITTFGAGNNFTFSGPIAAGTYDFKAVAAHEISEVLGRNGLSGGTIGGNPGYTLIDNFSYTGPGTKGLGNGAGNHFSIDNGTTLQTAFNNAALNGFDSRDWASQTPYVPDAFNQFENSGVENPVTAVDLQVMDVLGYDPVPVPEPAGVLVLLAAAAGVVGVRKRASRAARPTPR